MAAFSCAVNESTLHVMSEIGGQEEGASALGGSLDDLVLLQVLRGVDDDSCLVHLRLVSKRMRDLADMVLEERFKGRWGVAEVAQHPPAAPVLAAARPDAFVLCHRLAGRGDSLAALAVRYGTDVVVLKRLNNIMSDGALASRSHVYVPVADAAAAPAGQRVAFVQDVASKRRFMVILKQGEELPEVLAGGGGSGQRRQAGSSQAFLVAKLAGVLERALRIDTATAAFYVQQAGCDVRAAIEKYEEDRRWERQMRRHGPRLRP